MNLLPDAKGGGLGPELASFIFYLYFQLQFSRFKINFGVINYCVLLFVRLCCITLGKASSPRNVILLGNDDNVTSV